MKNTFIAGLLDWIALYCTGVVMWPCKILLRKWHSGFSWQCNNVYGHFTAHITIEETCTQRIYGCLYWRLLGTYIYNINVSTVSPGCQVGSIASQNDWICSSSSKKYDAILTFYWIKNTYKLSMLYIKDVLLKCSACTYCFGHSPTKGTAGRNFTCVHLFNYCQTTYRHWILTCCPWKHSRAG